MDLYSYNLHSTVSTTQTNNDRPPTRQMATADGLKEVTELLYKLHK